MDKVDKTEKVEEADLKESQRKRLKVRLEHN